MSYTPQFSLACINPKLMPAERGVAGQVGQGKHANVLDRNDQLLAVSVLQEESLSRDLMTTHHHRCINLSAGQFPEVRPTVEAHLLFQLSDGILQDQLLGNIYGGADLEAALTLTVLSSIVKEHRVNARWKGGCRKLKAKRKKVSHSTKHNHAQSLALQHRKYISFAPFRLLSPVPKTNRDAIKPFVIVEKRLARVLVLESSNCATGSYVPCSFSLLSPFPITPRPPVVLC
jgi:hypothetical protein